MKTTLIKANAIAFALLLTVAQAAGGGHIKGHSGANIRLERQKGDSRAVIQLQSQEPFFGFPPRGFIYGGAYVPPYPPPYPYYPPYPYGPYPPPSSYGPTSNPYPYQGQPQVTAPQGGGSEYRLIPAGRLTLLVDPVSAEVFVDGLRLTQRSDLTYNVALLEGRHEVEARADGFKPYSKVVEIPGGQQVLLTIRLDKGQ